MIKRYSAVKDNSITNAFKPNMLDRMTGSNTGESDVLPIFHIYGQASSASAENSRILIQFPITNIINDRNSGLIPQSGSVNFQLRFFNAPHSFTVPKKQYITIIPISSSWNEGFGLDTDDGLDLDVANWVKPTDTSFWTVTGGDYHTNSYIPSRNLPKYTYYMEYGTENIEQDITSYVEELIAASGTSNTALQDNGLGIIFNSDLQNALSSSYIKKFFARNSEYFFLRPTLEAQWDDSLKDNRLNFYASSSLVSGPGNLNTLVLYNRVRGKLKNIPGQPSGSTLAVRIFTDPSAVSGGIELTTTHVFGGWYSTGIYTASLYLNTTASAGYDCWYKSDMSVCYATGSVINILQQNSSFSSDSCRYLISMPNLKSVYFQNETAYFRVFTREYGQQFNIYTVANTIAQVKTIEDLFYRIKRKSDDLVVVDYGTGSFNHTRLSYDASGSYFNFDMSLLEKDYMYEISFLYRDSDTIYKEVDSKFKFRVI